MSAKEVQLAKTFRLLTLAPFAILLACTIAAGWVWKRTESHMTQVIEAKLQMVIGESPPSVLRYISGTSRSIEFQRLIDAANSFNHRYSTLIRADSKNDLFTSEAAPIIQEAERLMERGDASVTGYGRPYNDLGPFQIILSQTFHTSLLKGDTERAMLMLNLMKWTSSPNSDQVSEQEYFNRRALVKPFHQLVLRSLHSDQWNDDQLATLASWMKPNNDWQSARASATQRELAHAHRDYMQLVPSLGYGQPYAFPVAPGERHQWTEAFFDDATYQKPLPFALSDFSTRQNQRSFSADRWLSVPFMDQNPWSNARWRDPNMQAGEWRFKIEHQREIIAEAIRLRQHHRKTGVWLNELSTTEDLEFE